MFCKLRIFIYIYIYINVSFSWGDLTLVFLLLCVVAMAEEAVVNDAAANSCCSVVISVFPEVFFNYFDVTDYILVAASFCCLNLNLKTEPENFVYFLSEFNI